MKTTAPIRAAGLACLLLIITLPVFAQIIPPAPDCGNIITLCNGELENYWGSLENIYNPTGPRPLCGNIGTAHNTQWFAFVAGTEDLAFSVDFYNCHGPGFGMQAGIISECPNAFWPEELAQYLVTCEADCQNPSSLFLSGNFIPGKRYYLFLDGCDGAVCEYNINIQEGHLFAPIPQETLPIFGETNVCAGSIQSYYTPPIYGASNYEWTTSVPVNFYADAYELYVYDWLGQTEVDICVMATNDCFPTNSVQCISVKVETIDSTYVGPESYCEPTATGYLFSGDGNLYSAGVHEIIFEATNGCDSLVILTVEAMDSPTYNLDTTLCQGEFISLAGTIYQNPVSNLEIIIPTPDPDDCDSVVILNLDVLQPDASIFSSGVLDCALGINEVLLSSNGNNGATTSYQWSTTNGMICNGTVDQPDLLACAPGEYCLTVTTTDASGNVECTAVNCRTIIAQTSGPELDIQVTNADCGLGTGIITATVVNGNSPPYTFQWADSNGAPLSDPVNLFSGTYFLTVTAANGCSTTEAITVSNQSNIQIHLLSLSDLSCFGDTDGTITVEVTGGTAPLTLRWNNNQTGTSLNGLAAGTYTLTVTDADNCSSVASYNLPEPPPLTLDIIEAIEVLCYGQNDGIAQVRASGGTAPYTYLWDANTGSQATEEITNLAAGNYSVTSTDANGCTVQTAVTINSPDELAVELVSIDDVDCFGNATGSATAVATGGTGNLVIGWDNYIFSGSVPSIANLAAGPHLVYVSDDNNCYAEKSFTIASPPLLELVVTQVRDVMCFGTATGSASVSASGGTGNNYTYDWGSNANNQTGTTATNLRAGTYVVTATDTNACDAIATVTIQEGPPLGLTIEETASITCYGEKNGALTATVSGGVPGFNYQWSANAVTGTSGATAGHLGAGNYSVTVTDATGCTDVASYTLGQPALLDVDLDILPATTGQSDGEATATAFGGTPPYFYLWLTNPPQASNFAGGLAAGNYQLLIKDANDCQQWFTVTIGEN